MPAIRNRSVNPSISASQAARTRRWIGDQAAREPSPSEVSPFRAWGKTKGRSIRDLLSSTSFRAKVRKVLDDEELRDEDPEAIWAASVNLAGELNDELAELKAAVSVFSGR